MTVSAGDVLRIALEWGMPEEQKAYNVLGLLCTTGTTADAALLVAMATWVNGAYNYLETAISDQVTQSEVKVVRVTWSVAKWVTDTVIGTFIPSFVSTRTDDMLPHAVASNITFPTLKPTSRGRIFTPGHTEDMQDGGLLVASCATALANFANDILTPFTSDTASLSYAILGNDGQARVPTGARVNGLTATQRRRKPGVGI